MDSANDTNGVQPLGHGGIDRNAAPSASPSAESETISREIRQLVRRHVAEEIEKQSSFFKRVLPIISFIGFGTIVAIIKIFLDSSIENRLNDKVGRVGQTIEIMQFHNRVANMSYKIGISQNEIDDALAFLDKASRNHDILQDHGFRISLENLVDKFVSSNLNSEVDQIFIKFKDIILTSPLLVRHLLHHYGQDLSSREDIPKDNDTAMQNFILLENSKKHPQIALYYRLVFTAKKIPREDVGKVRDIDYLINAISQLPVSQKQWILFNLLYRARVTDWQDYPTPKGWFIQNTTRTLLTQRGTELEKALGIKRPQFDNYLKQHPALVRDSYNPAKQEKTRELEIRLITEQFLEVPITIDGHRKQ